MKNILLLFFISFVAVSLQAQSADDFFHQSAQAYIHSDLQTAKQLVLEGLNRYPNDPKLNELKDKLEEEEQNQQQQNQNQQNQNQDQEQEQEQQNQQQDQQQNEEDEQEQQNQQQEGQNESEPKEPEEGEAVQSKEISKEDAEKILKALAQKEKELLKEFKKQKSKDSATHDKDW